MTRHAPRANQRPNTLRIIAGKWRGMPIGFPPQAELRPTPDRVRETLFNWLQPIILDARCLDLFAGSGVLGFEALSRGAREVVCVDRDRSVVRHLLETAKKLRADSFEAVTHDAAAFLRGTPRAFDLIFLDPPYAANVFGEMLPLLAEGWLAPAAHIYIEAPAEAGVPALPVGWTVHRSKQTGQVGYHLLRSP